MQKENRKLKDQLDKANIVYDSESIIEDALVWYGGMNLLGKEDVWDNLMRIGSTQVAAELLAIPDAG
ncbi:MAG: hypothetical protein NC417_07410 [Candidatus Gastranaerophilales bacterium]|nr:hypothetical protein [Candidatus Gastranaerophilales bacterium]